VAVPPDRPLLVADVPWLLYRSFFALPASIKGSDGHPVNALLGTVNALLTVVESHAPRAVAACLGAEEATYRTALYPGYHAHRDPMPEDLARQWSQAPALLAALGFQTSRSDDLEADDLMFSHARTEAGAGGRALLLTADRDLFGAVDERVCVLVPASGGVTEEIGPAQVRARYGVDPEQVPDFIALRGDPSDGLPGAPGIGAKTAAALLTQYGSLEAVLAAAESVVAGGQTTGTSGGASGGAAKQMRPRIATSLADNAELLLKFKQIATLQTTPVERPDDRVTDYAAGARHAQDLGMNALARRLMAQSTAP
jgi:DNA polymerase-1